MKCLSFLLKINQSVWFYTWRFQYQSTVIYYSWAIPVSINCYLLLMGDSGINQLLSITHGIYSSFDEGIEVRSIFLDITKTFDKGWHDGIIFKLTQNGISGNLLNFLRDFLNERKQRVILNGQFSTWKNVSAGVPQGSILGPLLFLIYINDLTEGLSTNAKLFADDTSLFSVIHDIQTSANNLKDLERISNWTAEWKMNLNPDTTKQAQKVIFSHKVKKAVHPPLHLIMLVLLGHLPLNT